MICRLGRFAVHQNFDVQSLDFSSKLHHNILRKNALENCEKPFLLKSFDLIDIQNTFIQLELNILEI